MAGFLYFVPKVRPDQIDADRLAAAAVSHALTHDRCIKAECRQGPGDQPGVILAHATAEQAKVGYYPQRQQWRLIPGSEAWLGWEPEALPAPEELARERMLDGRWLEMADGRPWVVPLAREAADADGGLTRGQALPQRLDIDEGGEFIAGGVLPEYADLDRIARQVCEEIDEAEGDGRDPVLFAHHASATAVLAHNYRIGRLEAVVLGIFTADERYAGRVLLWLIDMPGYWQLEKKRGLGGGDTADGETD